MSCKLPLNAVRAFVLAGLTGGLLTGCTYDHLQRSDRVAYHTGDAVKANIERETANPTSGSMYDVSGLGRTGVVVDTDPPAPPSND